MYKVVNSSATCKNHQKCIVHKNSAQKQCTYSEHLYKTRLVSRCTDLNTTEAISNTLSCQLQAVIN